jgi:hypothetical protein
MHSMPWPGPPGTETPYRRTPGSIDLPVGDRRCATCMHPLREQIEAHLDASTSPPTIERILTDRGIPAPSAGSIRNHHRRHRVAPAAARRVQEATEQLDRFAEWMAEDQAIWDAYAPRIPARSPADTTAIPA